MVIGARGRLEAEPMKCPNCDAELRPARRHGLDVDLCPKCQGMWLSVDELDRLEDETFELGDDAKGTIDLHDAPSERACPVCSAALRSFDYRAYALPLEVCPAGHGYWLDADEDNRILQLMEEEEMRIQRAGALEAGWAQHMRRLRSGSFMEKLRDLFR